MRTFLSFAAASLVAASTSLASAQDAPPVAAEVAPAAPIAPQPAAPAVVIVTEGAPLAAPPPVWHTGPTADPVVMRRKNEKLMVGGLVMVPIGLAMAIGGGAWAYSISNKPVPDCGQTTTGSGKDTFSSLGEAVGSALCGVAVSIGRSFDIAGASMLAVAGGGVAIGGAVMAGVGARWVPEKPGLRPDISVGAGTVKLTWSF